MPLRSAPHSLLLAAVLLGSGCADRGSFPSLAPRPVEQLGFEEPSRPAPDVANDTALRQRVSALLAEAQAGQADFAAALGAAQRAVAAAGAPQGETWVVAHQAISRLESARRRTATAVADLDAIAIERAAVLTSSADRAALARALEEALTLATGQRSGIDALLARLRPA